MLRKFARFRPRICFAVGALLAASMFSVASSVAATAVAPGACGTVLLSGSSWLSGAGVDVESNGIHQGTAVSCATGSNTVNGVPSGAKWQCVELVNRLYLTKGWITSRWAGNGGRTSPSATDSMYDEAPANLSKQPNGSISSVGPGDVVSINVYVNGSFEAGGHVLIVNTAGVVTSGSIALVSQNYGTSTSATAQSTATLSGGTLTIGGGGGYTYSVIGVIHAPATGGGGGPPPDGLPRNGDRDTYWVWRGGSDAYNATTPQAAESFTATQPLIDSVSFNVGGATNGHVVAGIFSDAAQTQGVPGASLMVNVNDYGETVVTFPVPVQVNVGQTYYLQIVTPDGPSGHFVVYGSNYDDYPEGTAQIDWDGWGHTDLNAHIIGERNPQDVYWVWRQGSDAYNVQTSQAAESFVASQPLIDSVSFNAAAATNGHVVVGIFTDAAQTQGVAGAFQTLNVNDYGETVVTYPVPVQVNVGQTYYLQIITPDGPSGHFLVYGSNYDDYPEGTAQIDWGGWGHTDLNAHIIGAAPTPSAPVITGVSPSSGPSGGGTVVTVTGSGFTGATQVLFGATAGTGLAVVSDTQITVTSPHHSASAVNVRVVTPVGESSVSSVDSFTYLSPPVVTGVSPASGPTGGGTTVTLSGTGFTGATQVLFGSTAGTGLTVVSDTQITVSSPHHSASAVNVRVVTPVGKSSVSSADSFNYLSAPAVTGVSPASGPHAGGTVVTVTGSGFTGATSVLFGSTAGKSLTVVSDTMITVTSPAHSTGAIHVHVITPSGKSPSVSADVFTYQ